MTVPNVDGLPVSQDLVIPQGSRWSIAWRWQTTPDAGQTVNDVDVSGYKARMQMRPRAQVDPAYLTWSSDSADTRDGTIALDSSGNITVALDGSHGPKLTGVKKGVYDLYLWSTPGDDTTKFRFIGGVVAVTQEVTDSVVGS